MRNIILPVMVLAAAVSVHGFFERANYSAKSIGLSHALITGDDIYASYDNPAGIGLGRKIETLMNYEMPYAGFTDLGIVNLNGGLLLPLPLFFDIPGNVGLNVSYFSTPMHMELKGTLSYGVLLKNLLGAGTRVAVGANLHYYMYALNGTNIYVTENPFFRQYGTMSPFIMDLDIGGIYFISDSIQIGAVYSSILRPNISMSRDAANAEPLTSTLKLGGTWVLPDLFFMEKPFLAFAYEIGSVPDAVRKAPVYYHLGYEFRQFMDMLAVRVGAETTTGENDFTKLGLSLGLGFAYVFANGHEIDIDYGISREFNFNLGDTSGIDGGYGNHQFTLLYKWKLYDYMLTDNKQERFELKEMQVKKDLMNEFQNEERAAEAQKRSVVPPATAPRTNTAPVK